MTLAWEAGHFQMTPGCSKLLISDNWFEIVCPTTHKEVRMNTKGSCWQNQHNATRLWEQKERLPRRAESRSNQWRSLPLVSCSSSPAPQSDLFFLPYLGLVGQMLAEDREHRQRGMDSGCVRWGWWALPVELSVASAILAFPVPAGLPAAAHCFDVGVWVHAGQHYRDGYSLCLRTIEMDILMLHEQSPKL